MQGQADAHHRYKIENQINEGSFGTIFGGQDLLSGNQIVLKICFEKNMNKVETDVMKALKYKGFENFPELYDVGNFEKGPGMIVERLGQTLDDILSDRFEKFTNKTAYQIGIQITDLLEELHSIGYVHNDLKLDNICVGGTKKGDEQDQLKLIDFGIASQFVKNEGSLKEPTNDDEHANVQTKRFQGNYAFCSPNVLRNKTTSRRDDFLSLVYILIYLTTMKLPFFGDEDDVDKPEW